MTLGAFMTPRPSDGRLPFAVLERFPDAARKRPSPADRFQRGRRRTLGHRHDRSAAMSERYAVLTGMSVRSALPAASHLLAGKASIRIH